MLLARTLLFYDGSVLARSLPHSSRLFRLSCLGAIVQKTIRQTCYFQYLFVSFSYLYKAAVDAAKRFFYIGCYTPAGV